MNLNSISNAELIEKLSTTGLIIQTGPFTVRLKTSLPTILKNLPALYRQYQLSVPDSFVDFHVELKKPANFRRFIKSQVYFYLDGRIPFKPLPVNQAMPMLEWGLNWCISNHAHQYFILHAAVIEKNGLAIILPAQPGAGKSTLSAALMLSGWRLLSDELGLIRLSDGCLTPLARPINLKNESISIIRKYSSTAIMSDQCKDTNKGTVALLGVSDESVSRSNETVAPSFIISPKYTPGASAILTEESKAKMFMHAAENSFNYSLLGVKGFKLLSNIIDKCQCYNFEYSNLDDAVNIFNSLCLPIDT